MAKQSPYITAVRVERPATRSAADLSGPDLSEADLSLANLSGPDLSEADLRGADQALLERYQAVMRLAGGGPADKRNPDQAVIRDFVTGRTGADSQATPIPPRPMATRNPPRYNLAGIGISIALIVGSILAAVWLVMN